MSDDTTDDTTGETETTIDPREIGEANAPPVAEKPYKIVFEANKCIAAGRCAEVADNWEMSLASEIAQPDSYFLAGTDLEENVEAAEICPAKNGRGVIHVIDRESGEEIAPDPDGDGTLSVDW